MDLITRADLKALLAGPRKPCISIYLPTHRGGSSEDTIRWRKNVGEAKERLVANGVRTAEARELLQPARDLLEDAPFWRNQCDGLAFFLAPGFVRLYRLPVLFPDLVTVGDRFHVTPLLPLLSENGRFFVLALSRNAVRLLQATHFDVSEVDLAKAPRSLAEALRTHDTDEPLTFHTHPALGAGAGGPIYHGHGVSIDDAKDDLLRYFQQIDRGLHAVLHTERAPLVLAAVEYFLPIYRQANTYPHLLEQAIEGCPDRLSNRELHDRAWAIVEPQFARARRQAAAQYRQLAGTGCTSADPGQIVPAAYHGEVETLFIAAGRQIWGQFDPAAGTAETHEHSAAGDEDLLNFAAVQTLLHGKTVYTVAPDQVPDASPVAAVLCQSLAKHG